MKLAIIGGGGVRVPLLVNGLISRGLPIDHVALFDTDRARLNLIAPLAQSRAGRAQVSIHERLGNCVQSADFVVTSIRVGGLEARQHDEAVALARGLVGQETVGPAGFAMAIRTMPVLAAYAKEIATHAPNAWVINFTNPVGIVTQAMRRAATLNVIGICDTPTELFAEIAHALGIPVQACTFDYVGLNHLGWVREVYDDGRALLKALWEDESFLSRIYSRPLFPASYLAERRLLPTEYVYYYDFPERAVANLQASGTSRGEVVRQLTTDLFSELHARPAHAIEVYEDYLKTRSASYMQIESGQSAPTPPSPWADLTGYDRIAYDVLHAIVHDTGRVIPLNVPNDSNIPELATDDVIEAPCVVGRTGPQPRLVGHLPVQVRELTIRVKQYERRTIDAAESMARDALVDALALNPLVPSRTLADTLIDELRL
jgi:6-phospho-beta-glucosidase